jgi:hypothetical protein
MVYSLYIKVLQGQDTNECLVFEAWYTPKSFYIKVLQGQDTNECLVFEVCYTPSI